MNTKMNVKKIPVYDGFGARIVVQQERHRILSEIDFYGEEDFFDEADTLTNLRELYETQRKKMFECYLEYEDKEYMKAAFDLQKAQQSIDRLIAEVISNEFYKRFR